jgi:polysaccharide export outer membrane protein
MKRRLLVVFLFAGSAFAQNPIQQAPNQLISPISPLMDFSSNRPVETPTSTSGQDIRIGHDDLIDVSVFEIPELSSTARVTAAGTLVMPYVGAIEAAGKTPLELSKTIEDALRAKFVNDPHVTVFIREYASQPVSIIGAVKMPGIYQIKGEKLLLDMVAVAQGLSDNAGKEIHVIRRAANVRSPASEAQSEEKQVSVLTSPDISVGLENKIPNTRTIIIDAMDLLQNGNATLNIPIYAGDVINVLPAGSIFVVGELQHPGESILHYGKPLTVTQAVALGGGLTKEAKKAQAMIIRPHSDGTKEQIPVNIGKLLDGSKADVMLMANDVLFVPSNRVKTGLTRALDSTIAIVIGRAIYQGF